jgi:hypothetical protein
MTACSTTQYNIANAQTPRFNMPLSLHLHCAIEVGYRVRSVIAFERRALRALFEFRKTPPHIGERANIALGVNSRQLVHDRINSMQARSRVAGARGPLVYGVSSRCLTLLDLVKCMLFPTQNLLYTLSILSSLPQSSIHSHV